MKRTYVKPALVMEQFNLTQSIASGCGEFVNNGSLGKPGQAQGTCGWDMGNFIVWVADSSLGCTQDWPADQPYADIICYNNPNGNQAIFSS